MLIVLFDIVDDSVFGFIDFDIVVCTLMLVVMVLLVLCFIDAYGLPIVDKLVGLVLRFAVLLGCLI